MFIKSEVTLFNGTFLIKEAKVEYRLVSYFQDEVTVLHGTL